MRLIAQPFIKCAWMLGCRPTHHLMIQYLKHGYRIFLEENVLFIEFFRYNFNFNVPQAYLI